MGVMGEGEERSEEVQVEWIVSGRWDQSMASSAMVIGSHVID